MKRLLLLFIVSSVGIRAPTGHTICFVPKALKSRGAERVGYFTTMSFGKTSLEEYFRLRADPAIDVVPVTQGELDEGMSFRFDRLVKP